MRRLVRETCDEVAGLAMPGSMESLNVAARHVAADALGQGAVDPLGVVGQDGAAVERAHLQHHLHRLALAAKRQGAVRRARHRVDGAVDVRRGLAVEAQLPLARPATLLQRREIEEAEVHRLLGLQHPVGEHEDPGDRRLVHRVGRFAGPSPGLQPGEDLVVRLHG